MCCDSIATLRPTDDVEADHIPLTTGSVAEFYIEPMLPCVGDIDVMHYQSNQLAIPRGHPPPTQLPAEFHNYVKVAEIIDSHLPGYVYLELRYLLTYCPEDEKYNYVEYDKEIFFRLRDDRPTALHGPAALNVFHSVSMLPMLLLSSCVDAVLCRRCLVVATTSR